MSPLSYERLRYHRQRLGADGESVHRLSLGVFLSTPDAQYVLSLFSTVLLERFLGCRTICRTHGKRSG